MGRLIVKVEDKGEVYYLEWSTITDSPVTVGMSLDDFRSYYHASAKDPSDLDERLERCERHGTSSLQQKTIADLLLCNRAGKDETTLTKDQFVDFYCRRKGRGPRPTGPVISERNAKLRALDVAAKLLEGDPPEDLFIVGGGREASAHDRRRLEAAWAELVASLRAKVEVDAKRARRR